MPDINPEVCLYLPPGGGHLWKKRPEAELTHINPELRQAEAAFSLNLGVAENFGSVDCEAAATALSA